MRRILPLVLAILLSACNLQQEVELDLPEYEPELLVESYLLPGSPYFVVLSRTTNFFDSLALDFVPGAEITIQHGNQVDTLYELEPTIVDLLLDTDSAGLLSQVIGDEPGVYASVQFGNGFPRIATVPADYQSTFRLRIRTAEGDSLSATTRIPQPIPILYQQARFDDGRALVLTAIQDPAGTPNYYRRVFSIQRPVVEESTGDTTGWRSRVEQDFVLDDGFTDGELIEFGTGPDYAPGDSLIASVFHITADYFRFIDTRDAAIAASLSPFAQPAVLHTNIEGGQGIFTGFAERRDTFVVPRPPQ